MPQAQATLAATYGKRSKHRHQRHVAFELSLEAVAETGNMVFDVCVCILNFVELLHLMMNIQSCRLQQLLLQAYSGQILTVYATCLSISGSASDTASRPEVQITLLGCYFVSVALSEAYCMQSPGISLTLNGSVPAKSPWVAVPRRARHQFVHPRAATQMALNVTRYTHAVQVQPACCFH